MVNFFLLFLPLPLERANGNCNCKGGKGQANRECVAKKEKITNFQNIVM